MTSLISRREFLQGTATVAALSLMGPLASIRSAYAAGEKATMQLGWVANVEYMGMFVAHDAGYYADEGLDVELVPGGPAVSVAPLIAGGSALVGLDSTDTIARA